MLAVRDVTAASGRFPVILHAPGGNGSAAFIATSCEYLASHGYVVVSAPSRGQNALNDRLSGAAFYESQARDLEFALAFAAKLPYADTSNVGLLAYSRGGEASVLIAMRDSRIAALAGWDIGALEVKREMERAHDSPFYDIDRLTVPLLSIRASSADTPPVLFESARFAPRYWINVSGIHHLDFSVAAMIHAALDLKNEYIHLTPDQTRTAYAAVNVATRRFFDSFVKSKGAFSVADLQPSGGLSSSSLEAATAPPSAALLVRRIYAKNGIVSARSKIAEARKTSPQWRPFPESVLDQIGGRMIELGRNDEALQVLELNTDLYSDSARTWTSLGTAQEKLGRKDAARESLRKALAIDPKNTAAADALARLQ